MPVKAFLATLERGLTSSTHGRILLTAIRVIIQHLSSQVLTLPTWCHGKTEGFDSASIDSSSVWELTWLEIHNLLIAMLPIGIVNP